VPNRSWKVEERTRGKYDFIIGFSVISKGRQREGVNKYNTKKSEKKNSKEIALDEGRYIVFHPVVALLNSLQREEKEKKRNKDNSQNMKEAEIIAQKNHRIFCYSSSSCSIASFSSFFFIALTSLEIWPEVIHPSGNAATIF